MSAYGIGASHIALFYITLSAKDLAMKAVAIVNPIAGRRQAPRLWPRLLSASGTRANHVKTWWTEGPGHAELLSAQAKRAGFARVVAVGGDGTIFEVANGLWWEKEDPLPSLGMVPLGTGCDYIKNFENGQTLRDSLECALGEATIPVDLGLIRFVDEGGKTASKIFLNNLGLGFDAEVIRRFHRQRLPLRGRLPYALCVFQEFIRLKHYRLTGAINGEPIDAETFMFVAGLGRFFGGGIMITPGASPGVGRFQMVWSRKLSRPSLLRLIFLVHSGRHLDHPAVQASQGCSFRLAAEPQAFIEADGELLGRTPAEVKVIPKALRVAARGLRSL